MHKTKTSMITIVLIATLLVSIVPIFILGTNAVTTPEPEKSFSIMQISDTQHLPIVRPTLYTDTISWIVNNAASHNLKMVVHTGDIIDDRAGPPPAPVYNESQKAQEWAIANAAMSKLLDAGIPYSWGAGNHDQTPFANSSGTMSGSSYLAFNAPYMRSKPYWVSDIYDSKNTAVQFTVDNYQFLIINIEFVANSSAIAWMKTLLDSNPSANAIVTTHSYLSVNADYNSSNTGIASWQRMLKATLDSYPNVFLALSGHVYTPTTSANMTRVGGRQEILFDRQEENNQTGAASVRIYTFNLTSKKVSTSTYAVDKQTWLTDTYNQFTFDASITSDWTLTTDAREMKAYPNLKEYIWQKDARMLPNGQYDKIGLHRLVKTGITPKGVVFMLPGLYGSGESLVSNPTTDSFSKTENDSNCIYWANKGFDVYLVDLRNHFIPKNFNRSQLAFTADWGIDQFMGDIKEAVEKTKEVSGAQKLFMSGISWGGILAQLYAAKYWQQDLRGLVLLDPGPAKSTVAKNQNLTNSYNVTAAVNTIKTLGNWSWENPQTSSTPSPLNPGYVFWMQFAAQNPSAPAQYPNGTLITTINPRTNKTYANIAELIEYTGNTARSYNTYGGYGNITTYMNLATKTERYYPVRVFIEYNAMLDWAVCPYLPYDYVAHIQEINVPVVAFRSGLNLAAYGDIIDRMATADFTWTVLPNYGHLDVFSGTYSARDVSQPALNWMNAQLTGLKASAFCNVTLVGGGTWWFFAHSNGGIGTHTYQWFEGTTQLQGQTSMVLPATKNTPGIYTYYCKVTDSEGSTTNSNTVTLTVLG